MGSMAASQTPGFKPGSFSASVTVGLRAHAVAAVMPERRRHRVRRRVEVAAEQVCRDTGAAATGDLRDVDAGVALEAFEGRLEVAALPERNAPGHARAAGTGGGSISPRSAGSAQGTVAAPGIATGRKSRSAGAARIRKQPSAMLTPPPPAAAHFAAACLIERR